MIRPHLHLGDAINDDAPVLLAHYKQAHGGGKAAFSVIRQLHIRAHEADPKPAFGIKFEGAETVEYDTRPLLKS